MLSFVGDTERIRDQEGALYSNLNSAVCGAAKSAGALGSPASICVMLMVILTAISQYLVVARMETLRLEMGSVWATPPEHPMRVAFERFHGVSLWLEVIVLLAGITALYLRARETPADA